MRVPKHAALRRAAWVACAGVALSACSGGLLDTSDSADPDGSSPSAASAPTAPADESDGQQDPAPGGASDPGVPGAELPEPTATRRAVPETTTADEPDDLAPRPWPESVSGRDELVDDFPSALRPLRGSRTVSSSLSSDGTRLQVALEATTPRRPGAVLRAYRSRLVRHGLVEKPTQSVTGTEATTFRSGSTSIVVTARRTGAQTDYTVYGVVRDSGN